jgi:hypothetical protein
MRLDLLIIPAHQKFVYKIQITLFQEINSQVPNVTCIGCIENLTTGQIMIISSTSVLSFFIIVCGIVMCCQKKCNIFNALIYVSAFLLVAIGGSFMYLSLDENMNWLITVSLFISFISLFILIVLLSLFRK